jgi:hypothetical protein
LNGDCGASRVGGKGERVVQKRSQGWRSGSVILVGDAGEVAEILERGMYLRGGRDDILGIVVICE